MSKKTTRSHRPSRAATPMSPLYEVGNTHATSSRAASTKVRVYIPSPSRRPLPHLQHLVSKVSQGLEDVYTVNLSALYSRDITRTGPHSMYYLRSGLDLTVIIILCCLVFVDRCFPNAICVSRNHYWHDCVERASEQLQAHEVRVSRSRFH